MLAGAVCGDAAESADRQIQNQLFTRAAAASLHYARKSYSL